MSWIINSYIFGVVFIFVGPGMNLLNKTEALQSNIQLIFLVITVPLLLMVWLLNIRQSHSMTYGLAQNSIPVTLFAFLMALPMIYMFAGYSYQEAGKLGELTKPAHLILTGAMFLVALMIGALDYSRKNLKIFLLVSAFASALGNIIQAFYPQLSMEAGLSSSSGYVVGLYDQRNVAAMTIALLCAASLGYSKLNVRDIVLFNLCAGAILFTLSRQGMIMMFLLGITIIVRHLKSRENALRQIGSVLVALSLTTVAIIMIWNQMGELSWIKDGKLGRRFFMLNTLGFDALSDDSRTGLANLALEYFLDHPIFGGGYLFHLSSAFGELGPHNEFLKFAVDFGFIGLLGYAGFLGVVLLTFHERRFFRGAVFVVLMGLASLGTHNMMENCSLLALMALLLGESVPDLNNLAS